MPIPAFRVDGWLPEGHWAATWEEVVTILDGKPGSRRHEILGRLLVWRDDLRSNGVRGRLILNGSFVSTKERPGDCDCVLVYDDSHGRVDERPETKALTDYFTLKDQGLGDVFVFPLSLIKTHPHLFQEDVFDYDKSTKLPKGVLEVEI